MPGEVTWLISSWSLLLPRFYEKKITNYDRIIIFTAFMTPDGIINNKFKCILSLLCINFTFIIGKMQVLDYILAMTKSTTTDKVTVHVNLLII